MRGAGSSSAATNSPWYLRGRIPEIVPDAKPPIPLVTSQSLDSAASRPLHRSRPKRSGHASGADIAFERGCTRLLHDFGQCEQLSLRGMPVLRVVPVYERSRRATNFSYARSAIACSETRAGSGVTVATLGLGVVFCELTLDTVRGSFGGTGLLWRNGFPVG